MPLNPERLAREQTLERQISRMESRIRRLRMVSDRVSWIRVAAFIAGMVATYALAAFVSAAAAWASLGTSLVLFGIAVMFHRRLERWIETFTIWRDIRADQLARMRLDWKNLPGPAPLGDRAKKPLALDLDLTGEHSLHQLLDTTVSREGSRLVADWITQHRPALEQIRERQNIVRDLVRLPRFRDRFKLTFRRILQEPLEGENLLQWLTTDQPRDVPTWKVLLASILVFISLLLFALNLAGILPPYFLLSLLLYAIFYYSNQNLLNEALSGLVRLNAELEGFGAMIRYLEQFSYAGRENLARLCAPFVDAHRSPSTELRQVKYVTALVGLRSNPMLGLVLNLILPWDFVAAKSANRFRLRVAQDMPIWVDIFHRLDALIALANFADLNPEYAFPEIVEEARPVLEVADLGHPLIPPAAQVTNEFSIDALGEIEIITGSNMAGKSTFLKTVGINLCLAYAGAPVDATRFRSLPFRLHTCIRITDSIVDGFSYFYAEVRCLKRLLEEIKLEEQLPLLYLIDEIFRGTNNRERLLGSRAYIQSVLGQNGVGLLSTHDLELAKLADHNSLVRNYHFRDWIADGRLTFDYKIRPGPSPTTNALKIMQMEGLPVQVE